MNFSEFLKLKNLGECKFLILFGDTYNQNFNSSFKRSKNLVEMVEELKKNLNKKRIHVL